MLTLICYDALANTETGGVIDRKMTDKELRKLPRRDLLELLVQQTEDNEDLQSQLDVLNVQLQSRNLSISKAETLADAVVQINDLQKIADAVAKQFLDNVRNLVDRQEDICANMEQECQERCEAMVAEAERKCERKRRESDAAWASINDRLEAFYDERQGLRELLAISGLQPGQSRAS